MFCGGYRVFFGVWPRVLQRRHQHLDQGFVPAVQRSSDGGLDRGAERTNQRDVDSKPSHHVQEIISRKTQRMLHLGEVIVAQAVAELAGCPAPGGDSDARGCVAGVMGDRVGAEFERQRQGATEHIGDRRTTVQAHLPHQIGFESALLRGRAGDLRTTVRLDDNMQIPDRFTGVCMQDR